MICGALSCFFGPRALCHSQVVTSLIRERERESFCGWVMDISEQRACAQNVTVVVLGDAHSGKTTLVHRILAREQYSSNPSLEDEVQHTLDDAGSATPYRRTIGADMYSTTTRANSAEALVTLWDYPGNERLQTVVPTAKVAADVCLLAVDATRADALEHLDAWHDEFVHNCCASSAAPPMFVVVLTKCDAGPEHRKLFTDDVAKWAAREYIDPMLWHKDVVGSGGVHVPPVVECSAVTGRGVNAVLDVLVQRALLRQRLAERIAPMILDTTRHVMASMHAGGVWGAVVVGDLKPPPAEMFGDTALQRVSTDSGDLLVWNAPADGMLSGNTVACRTAHIGIVNVRVTDSVETRNSIRLWQEVVLREGNHRDVESLAWVVIGWHAATRTVDASLALSQYCLQHDILFTEMPLMHPTSRCDGLWSRLGAFARESMERILTKRAQDHGGCGTQPCCNVPCPWVGRADAVQRHLTSCPFVAVRCRWEGCTHVGPRGTREAHEHVCAHRPPCCHFCEQPFHGSLYEHLLSCSMRESFQQTHVPCPMASIGCSSTLIQRGEMKQHIDGERVEHIQLLAGAFAQVQSELLEQDRRHRSELESVKEWHAKQVQSLMGEILLTRTVADKQQETIKDMNAQFRLVWEELDRLRRAVRPGDHI